MYQDALSCTHQHCGGQPTGRSTCQVRSGRHRPMGSRGCRASRPAGQACISGLWQRGDVPSRLVPACAISTRQRVTAPSRRRAAALAASTSAAHGIPSLSSIILLTVVKCGLAGTFSRGGAEAWHWDLPTPTNYGKTSAKLL